MPPFRISRRELIVASASTAALGPLVLSCDQMPKEEGLKFAPPEPPPKDGAVETNLVPSSMMQDDALFPLGVQAGAMTSNSVVLWTYATDDLPKELLVWRDSEKTDSILLTHRGTVSSEDGYLKIRVEGLGVGYYQYAFFDQTDGNLSVRGPIGAFRTAFAAGDLRPLKIAGLTCSNWRGMPYRSLHVTAELGADVYCHLGDMSYNDRATTLEEYRDLWHQTLAEPGYLAALKRAGMYMTWDDHEITNNFNAERMALESPERFKAAKDAYFETLPVDRGENDRVWHKYSWGATAEFFVLDSRSERLPSTIESDKPIYIGEAQMAWLKEGLKNSPCKYKILLNSVPMTIMKGVWETTDYDRWTGYEKQRQELLDFLVNEKIEDVIFLCGDFHFGFIAKVEPTGPASKYIEIAVGPTGNGPNPLAVLAETGDLTAEDVFSPRQFIHYSGSWSASTLIELDPLNDRVHVKHIDSREDKAGNILFDDYI